MPSFLEDVGTGANITTSATLPAVIGGIIKGFLSLFCAIFLALMIYGGFKWMTAGGDAQKVKDALQVIRNAIIGLVIVVAAWSITLFVTGTLIDSTSDGGQAPLLTQQEEL